MKNSILRSKSYMFCIAGLIFAAGCNFSRNNGANRQDTQNSVATDSVSVSPADSLPQSSNAKLDSMLKVAATAKQDTNLVMLYYRIGSMYASNNLEKAKEYFQKIELLSEQLNWNKGRIAYANGIAYTLNREGLVDSALVIYKKALELAERNNDKWSAATLNMDMGTAYSGKSWQETALSHYMEALSIMEREKGNFSENYPYFQNLLVLYQDISQLYLNINNVEKAIEYGEKAVAIESKNNKEYAFYALAIAYSGANQDDKAKDYLEKALHISKLQNNIYLMGIIYVKLGRNALFAFDFKTAEKYLNQALKINKELAPDAYCGNYVALSKMEQLKGNYIQSEKYAKEALQIAEESNLMDFKRDCYRILSELAIGQRKYRENVQYGDEMDSIEKAMAKETSLRAAEEMEAKYETDKKELQITALQKEKRLMTGLSIAAVAVLLLALTTFFFLWRWTVQKRRLAEQHVKQLEQEKQLVATQSLLDGETQERTRLARDLHDGLGSMLTGVKQNLLEMKKGATLEYADVERFDKALGLLDGSVREMRRVAHHLMPDSLARFGLKPAVEDFCSNLPSVEFAFYGEESRLDAKLEVMIYRSIHELVNNALKHAKANEIMVQIIQEPDRISFMVQDDGCGFDASAVTAGMGLQNIRSRIAAYNGILSIDSRPDEGTEISVELKTV